MKSEPKLYEHGIQNEDSHIRAHVSVANKTIYVFETAKMQTVLMENTKYDVGAASQKGVNGITAKGWKVPVADIPDLRRVTVSGSWPSRSSHDYSTGAKGRFAVSVVCRALREGVFPMWIAADESDDASIQIAGTDVVLAFKKKIQVKCDWTAGDKPNGTGNLYLQFAERNPLKVH